MNRKHAFKILMLLLFLSACAVPHAASQPVKTLIPARTVLISPTPAALSYVVTTRAGQELLFDFIRLEPNEYVAFHTEYVPQGIPIANGVEVKYDYLQQVEFGSPSTEWQTGAGTWPVTITLTDRTQRKTSLGFKAHHQIHLVGPSNFGYLDIALTDIQKIVLRRTVKPAPIPTEPKGTGFITVQTISNDIVKVADPKFFARCMYEVYCCHDETLKALPIAGRGEIALSEIRSAIFTAPPALSLTLKDGQILEASLRDPKDCPGTTWRLSGKAILGDFEIEMPQVAIITIEQ
jgi:hypothetical protein